MSVPLLPQNSANIMVLSMLTTMMNSMHRLRHLGEYDINKCNHIIVFKILILKLGAMVLRKDLH